MSTNPYQHGDITSPAELPTYPKTPRCQARRGEEYPAGLRRTGPSMKSRLSLAPQGVGLDIRAVRGVHARLPLGLLKAHLDIATWRDKAVDDHESEHRDGIEDILPLWCGYVS